MSLLAIFALLGVLVIVGFYLGKGRAQSLTNGSVGVLHSRPQFYGGYVALICGLPALALYLLWIFLEEPIIRSLVIASLPEGEADLDSGRLSLLMSQIQSAAGGRVFGEPDPFILDAAAYLLRLREIANWAMVVAVLGFAIVLMIVAQSRIRADFRARNRVESIVTGLMIGASCIAIFTTLGIVFSLLFEAGRFFSLIPINEFLFGLNWEPQIPIREGQIAGVGAFGAVPVFWGTIMISLIAMLVAIPIGLFAAIYMSEYASRGMRNVIKPILEVLAGIPTIVYGFFAVLTVAPFVRNTGMALGLDVAPNSALAAGVVMGIMIIPFISSLSDDAITAVPQSLRDASFAMGATRAETVTNVLLPAALPGIVGGILLAVSRALGETMIVVMAAGLTARITANPFEGVTTVTVQIISLLTGDTAFDNPKTLAAFGLGLVLFLSTLALNIYALNIVKKYREAYD